MRASLPAALWRSIILKSLHPLVNGARAKWMWSRGRRSLIYMKLDPVKVKRIVREKGGTKNALIAGFINVSVRKVLGFCSVLKSHRDHLS